MAWLPIHPEELGEFEKTLGRSLPSRYKVELLDPTNYRLLAHPLMGCIVPGLSMQAFLEVTDLLKRRHPGFPRDAVVMSCGLEADGTFAIDRGYPRFWIPDEKDPTEFGNTVYSWDTSRRRAIRDCSIGRWISDALHTARQGPASGNENEIGRPDDPALDLDVANQDVAGWLLLTDGAARSMAANLGDSWHLLSTMRISGRSLEILDLGQVPDTAPQNVAPVNPGAYEVLVRLKYSETRGALVVCALRCTSSPKHNPTESAAAFWLHIDLGAVCLFDRQRFLRSVSTDERDLLGMRMLDVACPPCIVTPKRGLPVLVVPTGEGDGTYLVRTWRDTEGFAMEIDFDQARP